MPFRPMSALPTPRRRARLLARNIAYAARARPAEWRRLPAPRAIAAPTPELAGRR